ncbi:CCHC-type domain-containing protein, partial [Durusdinium trenchii]
MWRSVLTPTDGAGALIWRVATQTSPELPAEAAPVCQQAREALLAENYGVLREMLRLVLEEGEGPTEDLAELATSVLRHCPASCGQVEGGGFNVFAMAIALLRRLQPKEEIQLFLLQLLDDCRYSCQARKSVAAELKAKRMKALYVIEAALSTFCGPEGFDLGSTLLDEWLRPAM